MAVNWVTPAGDLGILVERISINISLQATSSNTITYSLLAGSLPRGLRLDGNAIKGSPTEVNQFTTSKFVVRANDGNDIADRTFSLSVDGSDIPQWVTKRGFLNVGPAQAYFVLDNSFVDYQLIAEDTDTVAGDILEYYLTPMGGEMPPGLTLTRDGRITGFTDPIFSIAYGNATNGAYDTGGFDIAPLDRMESQPNGYDSYLYDIQDFDYSEASQVPRRLSRAYSFVITVTDGRNQINRLFQIWVVTEEFLQADNSIIQVDTNLFTSDASSNRVPYWITGSNLGRHRANNYLTILLDTYRAPGLTGTLVYFLLPTNPDGSSSVLPPGMAIDQDTGDIAGSVPYQAAVTKNFTFTVRAVNFLYEIATRSYNLRGNWSSTLTYAVDDAVTYEGFVYICSAEHRNRLPTNPDFWISSVSISDKTFNIDIIGEIESAIEWVTESNLGVIEPSKPSMLYVEATSLMYGKTTSYELAAGNALPPGLELLNTGSIQGKVKQFGDLAGPGLTRFYEKFDSEGPNSSTNDSSLMGRNFDVSWDGDTTTLDRKFKFTIIARDSSRFAQSARQFELVVNDVTNKTFANLYLKAFQPKSNRLEWFNFITNATIFQSGDIYRYGDINFGVQTEIKIVLFAGIESKEAVRYVQAMSRNHYKKQLRFGTVKSAEAKDPITQETLYEVVYVDIIDEFEKNGKSISQVVNLPNNINSPVLVSYDAIKIDSNVPLVSDRDHQRIFPNSIKNMRKQIQSIGDRDRTYLPLWMRSLQQNAYFESGYVSALPLCYAKPGKSRDIISRIKLSGFDFKNINFTADRYLIDILGDQIEHKYLAFPQTGEKLP